MKYLIKNYSENAENANVNNAADDENVFNPMVQNNLVRNGEVSKELLFYHKDINYF